MHIGVHPTSPARDQMIAKAIREEWGRSDEETPRRNVFQFRPVKLIKVENGRVQETVKMA